MDESGSAKKAEDLENPPAPDEEISAAEPGANSGEGADEAPDGEAAETESNEEESGEAAEDEAEKVDPHVAAGAIEHTLERRAALSQTDALKSIAHLIDTIGEAGDAGDAIRESAAKHLKETIPGISIETAKARVEHAEKFFADLHIEASGVNITAAEKKVLKEILVEPALRGHLSGETLLGMAGHIKVVSDAEAWRGSDGGGRMHTDGRGNITVSKEALDPNFRNREGGKLNLRHMLTHESSHTAVDNIIHATPETQEDLEQRTKMINFSKEVLKLAERAKGDRIPQPQHIENILNQVTSMKQEYDKAKQADPTMRKTFAEYSNQTLAIASREILTDYTAIFLQSDGSKQGFMLELMSKIKPSSLMEYMKNNGGENISEDELEKQISAIKSASPEERVALLEKNKAMKNAIDMYSRAYGLVKDNISDSKLKRCAEIRAEKGDFEPDDWDGYMDSAHSFGDVGNGASRAENKVGAIADSAKGLFVAMANEVNILAPLEH